jgi:hypothetical protein
MVCLRNICINTLHKGDNDDDNDDDDNNNNDDDDDDDDDDDNNNNNNNTLDIPRYLCTCQLIEALGIYRF